MATTTLHPTAGDLLTTPEVARLCGVEEWQLRATLRRRLLTPPAKVGPLMLWRPADLPRVRAALAAGGYLPKGDSQ